MSKVEPLQHELTGSPSDARSEFRSAWAYWPVWRGSRELVQRAGRAAIWAARDTGRSSLRCRIDVYALGDVESFDSPEDFRDNVTKEALKNCDLIHVTVWDGDVSIRISLGLSSSVMRTGPGAKVVFADQLVGVWLEVLATASTNPSLLSGIRDSLLPPLERGRRRSSPLPFGPRCGESVPPSAAFDDIASFRQELRDRDKAAQSWPQLLLNATPALLLPVIVFAFPYFFEGFLTVKTREGDLWFEGEYEIKWVEVVLMSLLLFSALFLFFSLKDPPNKPSAVVTETDRRSWLIGRLGKYGEVATSAVVTLLVTVALSLIGIRPG